MKKLPILLGGLILGLFGLSNLLLSYHPILLHGIAVPASLLWLIYSLSLFCHFPFYWKEIQNTTLFTSCAPYPMATMLMAQYIDILGFHQLALVIWWYGVLLDILMFLYCTLYLLPRQKPLAITPSWTVLYVGIAMMGLTNPVSHATFLGWLSITVGLILTFLLTPSILRSLPALTPPLRPQVAILCAPFSLLLAASIRMAGSQIPHPILYALMVASQLFYFLALSKIPFALKNGFYPSFSALTFPLVISATSWKLSLEVAGISQYLPAQILLKLEEAGALLVVGFVTLKYICSLKKT